MKNLIALILIYCSMSSAFAGEIRIAVASNFAKTLKEIATKFEHDTGHRIKISLGSTGKHYAQIRNGAPFDIFFAADSHRPELLDKKGLIIAGSRFTYAQGKLVLWSPDPELVDAKGNILHTKNENFIAVANPKLAPYGKAAQQVLQKMGLWTSLRKRLVRGENIGQTFQFVKTGNAALGFVAASQIKKSGVIQKGSYWLVPDDSYSDINQQAVLLKNNDIAHAFMRFVRSEEALSIIHDFGYETP